MRAFVGTMIRKQFSQGDWFADRVLPNVTPQQMDNLQRDLSRAREEGRVGRGKGGPEQVLDITHFNRVVAANWHEVFTKFFRADDSLSREVYGIGLGLYIAKHLVEAQNGNIWVKAYDRGGSTFSFALPSANADGRIEDTPAEPGSEVTE